MARWRDRATSPAVRRALAGMERRAFLPHEASRLSVAGFATSRRTALWISTPARLDPFRLADHHARNQRPQGNGGRP